MPDEEITDEQQATALVERLRGDPGRAVAELRAAAAAVRDLPACASILWRGAGEAARWSTGFDDSATLLDAAIEAAARAGRDDLLRHARLTLSGTLYLSGRTEAALAVLDLAADGARGPLAARAAFQRATIMAREGRAEEALAAYELGLPGFEAAGDREMCAATLGNRAMVRLDLGQARQARRDLRRAQDLYRQLDATASVAWMEHNLGRAASREGDTIGALAHLRAAEDQLAGLGIDIAEVQSNRCEVLLQAGLYREAAAVARSTAEQCSAKGLAVEQGEATMHLAQALLGQLRHAEAAEAANRAGALFESQQRTGWGLRARALALGAHAEPRGDTAWRVVDELRRVGQILAAAHALALISPADAARAVAVLDRWKLDLRHAPLELRLASLAVRTMAAAGAGSKAQAMRLSARAVTIAEAQRRTLGSAELRAGVSAQLEQIRAIGLRLRLEARRAAAAMRWTERCRNAADLAPSNAPSTELAEAVSTLRAAQVAARDPQPDDVATLLRRQAEAQQRVLEVLRQRLPGRPTSGGARLRLSDLLGATVIQYHELDGVLGAIVVRHGRAERVTLASIGEIREHAAQLSRGLRRVAGGEPVPAALWSRLARLEELILPPSLGGRVVVAPTTMHLTLPWSALPRLFESEVTVAHRLTHWVGAEQASIAVTPRRCAALGGPGLATAADEVAQIGAVWPSITLAPSATTADALRAFADVDLVHFACHGRRRANDGQFTELLLTDGELVAVEVESLTRTPSTVILAACEAGALEPLPGDESAGFARALFAATTRTVIAATTLLPDTAETVSTMTALHRKLHDGLRPAAALAELRGAATDPRLRLVRASLSCFGWG